MTDAAAIDHPSLRMRLVRAPRLETRQLPAYRPIGAASKLGCAAKRAFADWTAAQHPCRMQDITLGLAASPPDTVDAIARAARRIETPWGAGTMVWRVWGSGEPLVLFHGGSGSWTHWIRNIP